MPDTTRLSKFVALLLRHKPAAFGIRLDAEGFTDVASLWAQVQRKYGPRYDRATFEQIDSYTYAGEGWGLCYDGNALYMSDGSPTITRRDPQTFEVLDTFSVTVEGAPVEELNELECVGDQIYANVWQSDLIVRFDKSSGIVDAVINAAGLLTPEERATAENIDVLNGIAYNTADDTFYITGKLWPTLFEVRFVEG